MDIKIKEVSKKEFKNLQSSQLVLELTGKSVGDTLVNTLRRLAYDYVPTYAFTTELITIDRNVSIFDNDYMRLRLSEITVPNINHNIYYLDDRFWKNVDFSNPNREKDPNDNKILELYINVVNNTKDVLNVTTEHVKVFENGVELKNKFDPKYPSLIIQLRPEGAFNCRCLAACSIGKNNHIFSAAGNAYFNSNDSDDKFYLTVESQGQMSEYDILFRSCFVMKAKLLKTKELVGKTVFTGNEIKLELVNEDHTLGYILNEYLQNNKDVMYSGISKPNLLIDTMVITLVLDPESNKKVLTVIENTIDDLIKVFDNIQGQIKKLGKI